MLNPQIFECRGQEWVEVYLKSPLRPVHSLRACTIGYRVFLWVNDGRGLRWILKPSNALVKKVYSYNSTPPYGLYRHSVLVKGGTGPFPGIKRGRGSCWQPHLFVPRLRRSSSISLLPLRSCQVPQCLYKGLPFLSRGKVRPGFMLTPHT